MSWPASRGKHLETGISFNQSIKDGEGSLRNTHSRAFVRAYHDFFSDILNVLVQMLGVFTNTEKESGVRVGGVVEVEVDEK
jgi:hypothetical protein